MAWALPPSACRGSSTDSIAIRRRAQDSDDFDAERAARVLLIAQERLLAEGEHARLSGDAQMLYALATRYLSLARQHYRAGRSYQAAVVATAVTRLADAILHLSWAAGTN